MKGELLKRLFRAIARSDEQAIDKLTCLVIEEERKKGHTLLAEQLEKIKQENPSSSLLELKEKATLDVNQHQYLEQLNSLTELPLSKRNNLPLATFIPRDKLRHYMVLPESVEERFQRIEREYAARDRLAHYGFPYRQKILLYGPPGCGKTLGAERLAWNTGLPLLKVRFDIIISSFLGETSSNLRTLFEQVTKTPCLLFLDECDSLAKSREDIQEIGEIKRVVNTFLQILDDYESPHGLLVAATNLNKSLDSAIWRRFDDVIEVPKPGEEELEFIIKQTLATVELGIIDWKEILKKMTGFSASQAVRVAQDAAKRAILERENLVIQPHLEKAVEEIRVHFN
jgi:SpoVK/Ycf46/Vps4 family AAA+-type ATPase